MSAPDDHTKAAPPGPFPATVTATPNSTDPNGNATIVQQGRPFDPTELPAVLGYVVSHEIARGGMGVVYAAHDPTFGRDVALKVMHADQDAGRFVIESKVTAQLPHPGVPPVHALGSLPDGRPFLTMKLVHGRTLADELKAAPLPRLLGIFEQICQTVGFAHSRGVIHRDLKPTNVMVGAFGEVLVMDWGLAKEVRNYDPDPATGPPVSPYPAPRTPYYEETVAGQVKGTPAYMAPEQARGESVDARADVFALGGVLAAMLTGKPPFQGATVMDTVLKAARAELGETFSRLDGCGADAELVAVAKRCLAAEPSARFADGRELAAAVSAYRAGVEERLRAAERDRAVSATEAREQRKRRKVQLALGLTVVTFLAGVALVARWHDRREAARDLADQRAAAGRERADLERLAAIDRDAADRRATEARLAGERDAEARNKAEQARQGVRAGLALATDLRTQLKFAQAGAAIEQAVELAKGSPELLPNVVRTRADLALTARLDDIRFRKWAYVTRPAGRSGYNTATASPEYRKTFTGYGLDVTATAPAELAPRIAASPVKAELVAALDDWATYEPDPALRDRLLEVARRADPGAWTDRLRTPAVRADRSAVAELASGADPAAVPPAAVCVLGALMSRHRLDPAPLMAAARTKYPTNFELAFALSRVYLSDTTGRLFGPLEAALALRPESAIV